MKKKKLLFVLLVLVGIVFVNVLTNYGDDLKNNYYYYINREVIDEHKLDDGEYSWSYFFEAQEKVDDDTNLVVDDILKEEIDGLNKKEISTIKNIYDKAFDMDERNKAGILALEPYLDRVWDVSTVEELVDVIILVENELGVDLLTNVEVIQDYKDNSKNIIYFYPVTYAFGANSDYMVNADYMTYKAYIRRACVQLWKAYGYGTKEAREVTARVFSFYESVSNVSKLSGELENIDQYYQVVSESDVNSLFGNVGEKYLSRRGVDGKEFYSLVDKEQYRYLNDTLTLDNLGVWKEVFATKILSSYASYGSSEYATVVDNLNKALLGDNKEKTNEDKAQELVKSLFSSEIDKVYVDKFLIDKRVQEIEKMFLEIKQVYKDRLQNNKWLSVDAKEKAILKLDKMKVIVGFDEDAATYDIANDLEVSNGSLINDIIEIQQLVMADDLKRLYSGEKISLVQQNVVNAYYQPLDNSIVIPVAFFELVNNEGIYYEKLGTLGMILAHEVTHAFDGNGSLFDEDGNLNNWWSETDKKAFEKLKQKVSNYYSHYEVLNGKYINGNKTVNENIADLGALACIVEIARENGANDKEMKIMFESFASIWASRESEEYMELLLLQDVHAPNQFRVNAVLSSIDDFYQLYNIYPWNEMWISKNNRIMVW